MRAFLSSLLFAVLVLTGCRVEMAPPRVDAGSSSTGDAGTPPTPDAPTIDTSRLPPRYVSARIEPAMAVIACDGTQSFELFATRDDGVEVPFTADWAVAASRLGTVSTGGTFTPRAGCRASGRTEVTATAPDGMGGEITASATITVRIDLPPVLEGVATVAEGDAAFARPSGAGTTSPVLYPLDGALLPNNIAPLDIQWTVGAAGDLYRVRVENASLHLTAYVAHTGPGFRYDWVPPRELWDFVAENWDTGLEVSVDRWSATTDTVVMGAPVDIRLTRSSIAGAVYYWGLVPGSGEGHFERISAATGGHERIIESPPTSGGGGGGCIGCHSVSSDGRFLAAQLNGGSGGAGEAGAVFDLATDLSGDPAETVFPTWPRGDRFWFSTTFNPDSTRLFITSSYAWVIDPRDGTTVATTGLPPHDTTGLFYSCDWSPDGGSIVTSRIDAPTASWGHKYSHGDLVTIEALADDAFGPPTLLHRADDLIGSPEGGRVDVHPAFSPDSRYVAFQHGTWSRTVEGTADAFGPWSSSALYLISRDGTTLERLDTAVSGAHGHRDYWPTFAPYSSLEPDGSVVMWVAFTSARDYGNAEAGTAAATEYYGRQIWVSALVMPGGEFPDAIEDDPSSVPFWLPGQNTALENVGAYWAPLACRASADACALSSDCCSGYCAPDAGGDLTCQVPPPDRCRMPSETCGTSDDCCAGLECLGNTCVVEAPI